MISKTSANQFAPDRPPTLGWAMTGIRLILLTIPPLMGLAALGLGQDASWDLRNYHFYNAFAYLTDRMGHDIAAAQVATYYNPLLHLPFYQAVIWLPPRAVGFILGLLPGCNVFVLYAIGRRVIDLGSPAKTAWFCLVASLVGLLGAAGISEIGTSYGDSILSLLVLTSLWLIVCFRAQLSAPGLAGYGVAAVSGLLAGAAFGLKQPFAVYAVGLCAAFFGLALPLRRRWLLAFVFGLGVLAGTAITGGFWMIEMWQRFENPFFPYFNQYFRSPWGAAEAYRDERFLPKSIGMALFFPIVFTLNPLQVGEVPFRDLRFAALYLLLIAWLGRRLTAWIFGSGAGLTPAQPPAMQRFLIVFMAVSFALWMKLFAVYRYLIVCEMLTPLALFLVLGWLGLTLRRQVGITLACFIVILVTLQPGDWGRRPWTAEYFGVKVPPLAEPQKTLVLVTGHDPMAYMIPFFPPQARFLRIHSYLTGPSAQPNATDRLMQAIIAGHRGPLFLIYRSYEQEPAHQALAAYGLERVEAGCRTLVPHIEPQQKDPFYFCSVKRSPKP
jgi:hypothetical protein